MNIIKNTLIKINTSNLINYLKLLYWRFPSELRFINNLHYSFDTMISMEIVSKLEIIIEETLRIKPLIRRHYKDDNTDKTKV